MNAYKLSKSINGKTSDRYYIDFSMMLSARMPTLRQVCLMKVTSSPKAMASAKRI